MVHLLLDFQLLPCLKLPGQVISGMEAVENLAVGEPPRNPDKMISVKLGKK